MRFHKDICEMKIAVGDGMGHHCELEMPVLEGSHFGSS